MAYDPNDPKDKATVQALIDAAVAEAADEHETATQGLKDKVSELRVKLTKAKAGTGDDDSAAEVTRLEGELTQAKASLKAAEKTAATATKQVETLTAENTGLNGNLEKVLKDQGLTSALTEAKVDAKFLPAVKALLGPQVALKLEGDERKAFVGDKSLGDFVKEWSQSDDGKSYISAPGNSGGGAAGSQGGTGGGKTMGRNEFEAMGALEKGAFMADGGTLTD